MEEVKETCYFAKKVVEEVLEEKVDIPVVIEEEIIVNFIPEGFGLETIICKGEKLKEFKKLADNIYEVFLDLEGYKITLPIKKINGLCCDPIFEIEKRGTRYCINFRIESPKLFEEEDGDLVNKCYYFQSLGCPHEDEFDKDIHILHSLIKIIHLLEYLHYCYGKNKLTTITNDNLELFTSVFETPNVEMCADKCCVCLTTTTNKTPCNHPLCFICWEQIKFHIENGEHKLDCPICRQNIQHTD